MGRGPPPSMIWPIASIAVPALSLRPANPLPVLHWERGASIGDFANRQSCRTSASFCGQQPSPRSSRGEGRVHRRFRQSPILQNERLLLRPAILSPFFTGRGSRQAGEGQRMFDRSNSSAAGMVANSVLRLVNQLVLRNLPRRVRAQHEKQAVDLSSSPCPPACSSQSTASCRAAFRRLARSGARRSCGGCP